MRAADRNYIRFTRSSIIIPPVIWRELGLKDGDRFMGSPLNDVNGSGMLYANNKTGIRGNVMKEDVWMLLLRLENRKP